MIQDQDLSAPGEAVAEHAARETLNELPGAGAPAIHPEGMTEEEFLQYLEAEAQRLHRLGWIVLPANARRKDCRYTGWTGRTHHSFSQPAFWGGQGVDHANREFGSVVDTIRAGIPSGIAVKTGLIKGGNWGRETIVCVDIDARELEGPQTELLPPTVTSGRDGRPNTQFFYIVTDAPTCEKMYFDFTQIGKEGAIELLANGQLAVVYGEKKDGSWAHGLSNERPTEITLGELVQHCEEYIDAVRKTRGLDPLPEGHCYERKARQEVERREAAAQRQSQGSVASRGGVDGDIPEWLKAYEVTPFDAYADSGEALNLLLGEGWATCQEKSDSFEITRPGKDPSEGSSGNFRFSDNSLYVNSTNAEPFEAGLRYTSGAIYAYLRCSGDMKLAARMLENEGFGKRLKAISDENVSRFMPEPVVQVVEQQQPAPQPQLTTAFDPNYIPIDRNLLEVPGIIGEFVRDCSRVSLRYQPEIALGGAIAFTAFMVGQKARGVSGTKADIYSVILADSSSGKITPINMSTGITDRLPSTAEWRDEYEKIETARRMGDMQELPYAPWCVKKKVGTLQGLQQHLRGCKSFLFAWDEMGRSLGSTKKSGDKNVTDILDFILEQFGADTFDMPATKGGGAEMSVRDFAFSMMCTTTRDAFFRSMSKKDLADGFASRMLLFSGHDTAPAFNFGDIDRRPSQGLIDMCTAWDAFTPKPSMESFDDILDEPHLKCHETPEAKAHREHWAGQCDLLFRDYSTPMRTVYGRVNQLICKLSLIHACSKGPQYCRQIGVDSVSWAIEIVRYSLQVAGASNEMWVSGSTAGSERNEFVRAIHEKGASGISRSDLNTKLKDIRKSRREELLAELIESDDVRPVRVSNGKEGRGHRMVERFVHRQYLT